MSSFVYDAPFSYVGDKWDMTIMPDVVDVRILFKPSVNDVTRKKIVAAVRNIMIPKKRAPRKKKPKPEHETEPSGWFKRLFGY